MDHEAFEKEMIDTVNRHAEEKTTPSESIPTAKLDAAIMKRGLKRMGIALLTTVEFIGAVFGFIWTTFLPGYLAVLAFLASDFVLVCAICMLYAQGITRKGIQGDNK